MSRQLACFSLLLLAGSPLVAKPVPSARASVQGNSPLPPVLYAPARVAMAFGVITSGYRTPAHNRFIGGVPNSHHLYGRALDVARRPGVSHRMVEDALRRAGFRLIESLDEGDHSHFAFATSAAPPLPVAAVPTPPVAPVAATPAKPLRPVLADQHGTLVVADATLAREAPGSMSAPGGQ